MFAGHRDRMCELDHFLSSGFGTHTRSAPAACSWLQGGATVTSAQLHIFLVLKSGPPCHTSCIAPVRRHSHLYAHPCPNNGSCLHRAGQGFGHSNRLQVQHQRIARVPAGGTHRLLAGQRGQRSDSAEQRQPWLPDRLPIACKWVRVVSQQTMGNMHSTCVKGVTLVQNCGSPGDQTGYPLLVSGLTVDHGDHAQHLCASSDAGIHTKGLGSASTLSTNSVPCNCAMKPVHTRAGCCCNSCFSHSCIASFPTFRF